MIKKTKDGYELISHVSKKKLGKFKTKKAALERENEIKMFKHINDAKKKSYK
jgi:hypothetical protein